MIESSLPESWKSDLLESIVQLKPYGIIKRAIGHCPECMAWRTYWRIVDSRNLGLCMMVRLASVDHRYTCWLSYDQLRIVCEPKD